MKRSEIRKYRHRKLWDIMVQYFGKKPSFSANILGSKVHGSKV